MSKIKAWAIRFASWNLKTKEMLRKHFEPKMARKLTAAQL
jgi:hypothetical protein